MPVIKVRENEPFDVALRRFKRSCEKAGVLAEVRRREFYEKPTTERKRAKASAALLHSVAAASRHIPLPFNHPYQTKSRGEHFVRPGGLTSSES